MAKIHPFSIPGIFTDGVNFYTINLNPGRSVYGENLILEEGTEYRTWNPKRSKLSAYLQKGLIGLPITNKSSMLYLGAASGTTVSHLSDVLIDGTIYCVEFARRPFRDLVTLSELRPNLIPILADARKPQDYANLVQAVDLVYQDIAQADQAQIFLANVNRYLKPTGQGILILKTRSVDVALDPATVLEAVLKTLKGSGLRLLDSRSLEPFEEDHFAILVEKRSE